MTREERDFLEGMLAALGVVYVHGQGQVYREIVTTAGGAKVLLQVAEGFDREHLLHYYTTRGTERVQVRRVTK